MSTQNPKNPLQQVYEFHKTFKHPVLESPQVPDFSRADLRHRLLKEELEEFQKAYLDRDIVEVADALADLQYVLLGTVLEFGLRLRFSDIFREVHRSNMSKVCHSEQEAIDTIKANAEECYAVPDGDKWLVYRRADNKTIKSIKYSPADIQGALDGDYRSDLPNRAIDITKYFSELISFENVDTIKTDRMREALSGKEILDIIAERHDKAVLIRLSDHTVLTITGGFAGDISISQTVPPSKVLE